MAPPPPPDPLVQDLDAFAKYGAKFWRGRPDVTLRVLPTLASVTAHLDRTLGPDSEHIAIETAIEAAIKELSFPYRQALLLHLGFASHKLLAHMHDTNYVWEQPPQFSSRTDRETLAARAFATDPKRGSQRTYRRPRAELDNMSPHDFLLHQLADRLLVLNESGGQPTIPPPSADSQDPVVANVRPEAQRDVNRIIDAARAKGIGTGVIRDNWQINLRYDLSAVSTQGRFIELIQWSYDLLNVSMAPVNYEIGVTSLRDEHYEKELQSFTRVFETGEEESLLESYHFTDHSPEMFSSAATSVTLEPGARYNMSMYFRQGWPVSDRYPQVHNCFSPRETCLRTRIAFAIPDGYEVGVILTHIALTPRVFAGMHEYLLPGIMLAGTTIEYILRPQS